MLRVGQKAPEFTLDAVVGQGDFQPVSLSDYRGKWVVFFFYPLDFTVICPTELQEFSRREADFRKLNAVVIGASCDSVHSHKAWIGSTLGSLSFPLASDLTRDVARRYGALLEEKGHSMRATFIIDPQGVLQYALYQNTNIGRSVRETLRVLDAFCADDESCAAKAEEAEAAPGR